MSTYLIACKAPRTSRPGNAIVNATSGLIVGAGTFIPTDAQYVDMENYGLVYVSDDVILSVFPTGL
ncbi:hypothetical protein V8E55_009681 [Tylopilus felleus]